MADAGRAVPLLPADTRLVHLATCGSTNAEARARAGAGDDLPLWVLCDAQTAGRGRSGRAWSSGSGNLLASLAVPLAGPAGAAPQLSLLAGVATVDAILKACGRLSGLRLKWPNDLLIGGDKLGGILVEVCDGRFGRVAVIGIGLNLATAPEGLDRRATSLAGHGIAIEPIEMLAFLAEAMHDWLAVWRDGTGFHEVRLGWLARSGAVGEAIAVNGPEGAITGRFAGLAADGALLLATTRGEQRRITFGDVSVLDGQHD